jgi:pimeloyl-ACP methyl ester carboxylesterase
MKARVLRYDDQGQGEPIVMVPGGLTGWLSWIPHQERLADGYRAIRVQPIHNELGSAGVPGDPAYTAVTEREALRLTLDVLGLERPHFAGWSAGASALIEFAIEYPDRIRSLTLVEPSATWILEQLGDRLEDVERVTSFVHGLFGRPVTEDELAAFLEVAGLVERAADAPSHPDWPRWLIHRTTLSWLGQTLDHPDRSVEELARITCPVLLTKGTRSVGPDRRLVDVLGARLPDASVVELEGDHAHHIESIDAFLQTLEAHLTGSAALSTP